MQKWFSSFANRLPFYIFIALSIHIITVLVLNQYAFKNDSGLKLINKNRNIDLFMVQESFGKSIKRNVLKPGNNSVKKSIKTVNNEKNISTNFLTNNLPGITNSSLTDNIAVSNNSVSNEIESNNLTNVEFAVSDIRVSESNTGEVAAGLNITVSNESQTNEMTANGTNTEENLLFNIGEKIFYDVEVEVKEMPFIKGVVGSVAIEVNDVTNLRDRPVFHCSADVRSLDSIINLYILHDEFHTWFDAEFLQTYQIEKIVREGGWLDHITNSFFSDEGYGIYHFEKFSSRWDKV